MISIGGHSPDSKQDQRLQRTNVLVGIPQLIHIIIIVPAAVRLTGSTFWNQSGFLRFHFFNEGRDRFAVEAYIRNCGEETLYYQSVCRLVDGGLISFRGPCKADERTGEPILQFRCLSFLAAYAGMACAGRAACCLFTLKTKHFSIHHRYPPYSKIFPSVEIVTTCQGILFPLT